MIARFPAPPALLFVLTMSVVASFARAEETKESPAAKLLHHRQWQGIPGIEETAKGRLFVSWYTGGEKEPSPQNTGLLAYSDDGGKTFTSPAIIASPNDAGRAYDPTLWIDPQGRLWYIYNRGDKVHAKHGIYARRCDDPDAKEPVWSDEFAIDLGPSVPYAFRMNKPAVLKTGEWLLPVTHWIEPVYDWFARPNQLQGVAISTDEGKTWKLHGAVKAPHWALENMVVELKDGRIWMLIRSKAGPLWESFSSDRGMTWSEGKPSEIESPGSRFFISRLASGDLLLVNHHKFRGRSHMTARVSTDDGKTWNDGLLLDERKNVSYPDAVQGQNGLIRVIYDRERYKEGEILMAQFKEEDARAGRDVSGSVKLRQVVDFIDPPLPKEGK